MSASAMESAFAGYLQEHAPIFSLRLDDNGNVIAANRFATQLGDSSPVGKHFREVFLFLDATTTLQTLCNESGKLHLLHVGTRAGLPETFRVCFMPQDGEVMAFGSLDSDETMQLRKELLAVNNQLNLLTRDLQKSKHELEELHRVKNLFLGMASHDLRKPVSAILGYSEFLLEETKGQLGEEHTGFLRTIHKSTGQMRQLIDDFLDVAMIEAGRFDIKPALTNLQGVVESSLELHRLLAGKRGIRLEITGEELPCIQVDAPKIEQVLNNLLANAIEHSPDHSAVSIHLHSSPAEAVITITDSGPGLDAEQVEKLFNPYAGGVTSKVDGTRSTGLGLVISRKIIEAHGGSVRAIADKGKGGMFVIALPLGKRKEHE